MALSAIKPSIVPTVNPDKDGYDNNSVSANLRHSFSDAHSLSASLFDSNATNQTDNAFGATTDVNSSKSHLQKTALVSDNRFTESWQSKLQLSQGVDDYQNYSQRRTEFCRSKQPAINGLGRTLCISAEANAIGCRVGETETTS